MEEWINLDSIEYVVQCDSCEKQLTVIQHGNVLNQNMLNKVVLEAHKKEAYDSFSFYYIVHNGKLIRINVDILNNFKCEKYHLFSGLT